MLPFQMVTDFAVKNVTKYAIQDNFATWSHTNDTLNILTSYKATLYGFNNLPKHTCLIVDNFTISLSQKKITNHIMHINDNIY